MQYYGERFRLVIASQNGGIKWQFATMPILLGEKFGRLHCLHSPSRANVQTSLFTSLSHVVCDKTHMLKYWSAGNPNLRSTRTNLAPKNNVIGRTAENEARELDFEEYCKGTRH
jgi:hypothetical protein